MVGAKRNRRPKVKSTSRSRSKPNPVQKASIGNERSNSKQQKVLDLLRRPEGASIAAVGKATGWQHHSVRGFFAGLVRKKLGLKLESAKTDGVRIYKIVVAAKASKPTDDVASTKAEAA